MPVHVLIIYQKREGEEEGEGGRGGENGRGRENGRRGEGEGLKDRLGRGEREYLEVEYA